MTIAVNRNLSNCENSPNPGSNPFEAPKTFFSGYFRNCLNCDSLRWSHTHFTCIYFLANTVEPLLWDTFIHWTRPFRGHKLSSRKNIHITFVPVTSIEGTLLFKGHLTHSKRHWPQMGLITMITAFSFFNTVDQLFAKSTQCILLCDCL